MILTMWIARHIVSVVQAYAREFKIVAIVGPRQSGKTTLARHAFPDRPYVNLEELDQRRLAQDDPRGFLDRFGAGAVIDEVQRCPDLLSYLQGHVDASAERGRFILTGSQHLGMMESITQTLAGRVGTVQLLPFSYAELQDAGRQANTLEDALFRGGYPPIFDEPRADPLRWLNAYLHTYVERDVRLTVNIRDLSAFQRFLSLCAGHAGQLLNTARLGADCGISHGTVRAWLSVLEAGFVVTLLRPHHENFRKRLVKAPKLYFLDTGLLVRLLQIETPDQLKIHPLRGAVFENWVLAELLKSYLNRGQPAQMYFWRDQAGHEVDLVRDSGSHLDAWECKSGMTYNTEWAESLDFWRRLAGPRAGRLNLVYGGRKSFAHRDVKVAGWTDVSATAPEIR
ncbi:MAG: ATP-binding protein [Sedimentisphaerales bacterium]|nr:ATP-binding protein [Sedimentisphaerales bacterium]